MDGSILLEILALSVLGAVCRILLPSNGMGREARFILGVLLLMAALAPLMQWLGAGEGAAGEASGWYASFDVSGAAQNPYAGALEEILPP